MVKFILTGVVTIVRPNTHVQLWFGGVVTLLVLTLQVQLHPFKSASLNLLQQVLYVQLLITYLTAHVFFVPDSLLATEGDGAAENDSQGYAMLGVNMVTFLIIAGALVHKVKSDTQLDGVRLRFRGGQSIQLLPPSSKEGFHLFVSHLWKHAQDQAGTIKASLKSLIPSLVTFLGALLMWTAVSAHSALS